MEIICDDFIMVKHAEQLQKWWPLEIMTCSYKLSLSSWWALSACTKFGSSNISLQNHLCYCFMALKETQSYRQRMRPAPKNCLLNPFMPRNFENNLRDEYTFTKYWRKTSWLVHNIISLSKYLLKNALVEISPI